MNIRLLMVLLLTIWSCKEEPKKIASHSVVNDSLKQLFKNNPNYVSDGFDFPVGKPNGKGYYNAQKFKENNHLGDDWNGVGGGNTDFDDPIFSISNGYVTEVKDYKGGWGKIVRVAHLYKGNYYESVYAHCNTFTIIENMFVKKGQQIATIGDCNGNYLAHLHLELRDTVGLDIGGGYSSTTDGYLNPTTFIKKHRK